VTCPACTAAAASPSHSFNANCRGCCARSISRSPQFFESRKQGAQTRAYRTLLEQIGGLVQPPVTHAEVRAAFSVDAANRPKVTTDETDERSG
jgi:hypothetical protein